MEYKLTVGLEIHAELNTRTKMFCDSKNNPDETRPNVNVCPVCMGHPGTLPVINKGAVKSILKLGVAVGGELADYTEFDRKNYFYPDIPKGYQISQYKHPLVKGGELAGVKLTRIHLEEDTAKSLHDQSTEHRAQSTNKTQNTDSQNRLVPGSWALGSSLIDFNRAGVPLMELVTEPVISDAETAAKFAKELQLLLTYLGISEANMEKGELRLEANVSVSNRQPTTNNRQLGTKVEVKNLNSFRSVERAIRFEFERQVAVLEKGEKVVQETRGWDENRGETFSQRLKEESQDYRYFPDPDLPKLFINEIPEFNESELKKSLPELPWQKRERLLKLGISAEHAEIYVSEPEWGNYFEEVVEKLIGLEVDKLIPLASNYITSELKKPVDAAEFAEVIRMIEKGELSSKGAKGILRILGEKGGEARKIAQENNMMQISDKEVLRKFAEEAVAENKKAPIEFLVGQVVKKTQGRANPLVARELLLEMLERG
jgi:aspartyl-tRNA(Asn)/glutamyl-tRNA(Gln) amidotransferase subunit B